MNEPLILLPGMMCDARLFLPQISALSHKRPVTVMPLRGETSVTALARRVLDNTPQRFALAGLSMGGLVAMEIMRLSPERITRLALLDTNPFADPPEKAPIREEQVRRVIAGELRAVMRDEMKPNYLAESPYRNQILGLCMDMAEILGPEVFAAQSEAIQNRPDQCETLKSITVPSLVLCGREDQLCSVTRHERMYDLIPNSDLVVIEGAGHLPTLEQHEATNRALEKWLS